MRTVWDYWNHQRDVISLKISKAFKDAVTIMPSKRDILIAIARPYHPIGYLQTFSHHVKNSFTRNIQVRYKMG